jgi:hypothetical protein
MSHYKVGVLTKSPVESEYDIEDILEKYSEHLEVPKYIYRTKEQIIESAKNYQNILKDRNKPEDELSDWEYSLLNANTDDEFFEVEASKDSLDEDGNEWSTYNPNSKWDYYSIVEPEMFTKMFIENTSSVSLKDYKNTFLDEVESITDLKNKYPSEFQEYTHLITNGDFYKPEYYQGKYPTFYSYLKNHATYIPWALLIEEGDDSVWIEPGKVGWFGTTDASIEDERDWPTRYEDLIKDKSDDLYITFIDCHI